MLIFPLSFWDVSRRVWKRLKPVNRWMSSPDFLSYSRLSSVWLKHEWLQGGRYGSTFASWGDVVSTTKFICLSNPSAESKIPLRRSHIAKHSLPVKTLLTKHQNISPAPTEIEKRATKFFSKEKVASRNLFIFKIAHRLVHRSCNCRTCIFTPRQITGLG